MNRGDVVLVRFPHPSGLRGKKRPAVIVQSDAYAAAVSTLFYADATFSPHCMHVMTDCLAETSLILTVALLL